MNSIAVIGAGGFVGQSLIESLVLDSRAGVRAVVRSYRNMASLCRFGAAIDLRCADAEDPASLSGAIRGAHTVVNLVTGPPSSIVRSTRAIVEACSKAGVRRLIHLSSAVVYGDVLTMPGSDDEPPIARHWMPYARAKAESEVWLRSRLGREDLDIVVLRPGIVWGVRSPHTLDSALRLARRSAYLVDGGRGIFNGIFIANLTSCIRSCCDHPRQAAGFYNVGDREVVTWRQFYDALAPAMNCDTSQLPVVDGERFPRSIGSMVDAIQSQSVVNQLYHRLKVHVPDGWKAAIRSRLDGQYQYDRWATTYATPPSVDREMWHLQRVRYKLPSDRFANTFQFCPPVSFREATCRTIAWLASLGLVSSAFPTPTD